MIRTGRKYTPSEVLQHFEKDYIYARGKSRIDFDGHSIKMGSHRYWTFAEKGTTCVSCGLEGRFFVKEKHSHVQGEKYHFNLYGIDEEGDEVLFTKDHIVPKRRGNGSKGGSDHIDNYQTMCKPCNEAKGHAAEPIKNAVAVTPLAKKLEKLFHTRELENVESHYWGFFFDMAGGISRNRLETLSKEFGTSVVQCQGVGRGRIRIKVVINPTTA
jgi:hypothetical protein